MSTSSTRIASAETARRLAPDQPLAQQIRIGAGFSRSINLERDHDSRELLQGYVPTSRALAALEQLAEGLNGPGGDRALALIGPYGAGKSAFALFASALLGAPQAETRQIAEARLAHVAPYLARQLRHSVDGTRGLLRVQINGIPDSLIRQLMLALARAAEQADLPAPLITRTKSAARPGVRMDCIIDLITQVKDAWVHTGGRGLLIEIDELGKFLEFEAQGSGQHEIHLLQLLAEKAAGHSDAPLCVLVMLHQAFEHYGARLGKSLRDEWNKVQGRFSAIAFLEPAEQALRVVAAAFDRRVALDDALKDDVFEIAAQLAESSALPLGLDLAAANTLFDACYPLHPVTLLILPTLCQRVAQNERTLFSYLASTEVFGLGRRLQELHPGEWIGPWELFDYFILNQAGGFSDPLTYHRWVEVITALERFEGEAESGSDEPAVRLLKTIGLLNLVGAQRGLKASDSVLRLLFGDDLDALLETLQVASIIQFRRYAQEFRVWQGSDFDLHAALEQASAEHSARMLADTLNALAPLPPVVARRASIETGTLRSFQVGFASAERWPPAPSHAELTLWLYLAEADEQPDLSATPQRAVVAICRSTEQLRERVAEWQALVELPRQHAQLQQDPVAKREHQSWLETAEAEAINSIRALLEAPEQLRWWIGGEMRPITTRRELQVELSDWALECFRLSPRIRNELINRERPSTSAATGRKKLLAAMLSAPEHEGLGIAKTPAEKSLYLSLLHESRLHRAGADGHWDFYPPDPKHDPCRLGPAWRAIDKALGDAGQRQVPITELYAILQAPPFGMRLGVLPILIITYLIARRREVALYQEGAFSEQLSIAQAELLCRRPALFAIERFELRGLRGELFQRYLGSIVGALGDEATLLDIVRPLMRFAQQLPDYSQHCSGLSSEAERVRAIFRQAKSPGQMLFTELPQACGFDPERLFATRDAASRSGAACELNAAAVEPFITRLISVLRELNAAYPALLEQWHQRLAHTLLQRSDCTTLADTRAALVARYQGLDRYAAEQGNTGAFIRRLCETRHEDHSAWLESVMTLLAKAPPTKWRESQRIHAELRLDEMGTHLADLEVLCQNLPLDALSGSDAENTLLLKLVRPGCDERRHLVQLDVRQRQAADAAADALEERLSELDTATRTAVLATLMERLVADELDRHAQPASHSNDTGVSTQP